MLKESYQIQVSGCRVLRLAALAHFDRLSAGRTGTENTGKRTSGNHGSRKKDIRKAGDQEIS